MFRRGFTNIWACITLMCVVVGCGDDREPRRPFLLYVPESEDAGADADVGDDSADVEDLSSSPECEGIPGGNRCAMPNGTGVCVQGQCQLLACQSAFLNCDDQPQNGCEQDITQVGSCGGCGIVCRAGQSCQSGERGYVCSSGVACPKRQVDLDADASNGCEWQVSLDQSSDSRLPLVFSLEVGALSSPTSYMLAGRTPDERVVGMRSDEGTSAEVLLGEQAQVLDAVQPLSIDVGPLGRGFVGWDDGQLSVVADLSIGGPVVTVPLNCASDAFPKDVVSVSVDPQTQGSFSIQGRNLIGPEKVFGSAEYTRAFFPYAQDEELTQAQLVSAPLWRFASQEVLGCEPCVLNRSTGELINDVVCWGPAQCQGSFDASVCGPSCTPESIDACPDFLPVHVVALAQSRVVVLTLRGALLLEYSQGQWVPLARFESSSLQADAPRVLAGTASTRSASVDVALLLEGGIVRTLSFEQDAQSSLWGVKPLAPDFALALATGSSRLDLAFGPDQVMAITDGQGVWLIGLSAQGTRVARLLIDDLPGTYTILDVLATQDGFAILRDSSNTPVVQTVTRTP